MCNKVFKIIESIVLIVTLLVLTYQTIVMSDSWEESKKQAIVMKDSWEESKKQAEAAIASQSPVLITDTQLNSAAKEYGIYITNSGPGVAIWESIKINEPLNPVLTKEKWSNILKSSGMTDLDIDCFAFSLPQRGYPLAGNKGIGLVYVRTELANSEYHGYCASEATIQRLEKAINVEITYKSMLENQPPKQSIRAKLWEEM